MRKKLFFLFIGISLLIIGLVACSNEENQNNDDSKGTLELAVPPWVNSEPQAWMVKVIIEDHLGWDVNLTDADVGVTFAAIANGTTDFFVDAWIPGSHDPFVEEHEDNIEILEPHTEVPPNGLVVPEYVEIDSLEELNEYKDEFNGEIIGVEPGAGMHTVTEAAIESYGLDYTLVEGSDFAMTAAIQDAVDNDEWIVTLGWSPHWMFTKFDLKYLDDPQEAFSGVRNIHPIVALDFEEKAPEVVDFLNKWEVDTDVWDELINRISVEEEDPEKAVRDWIEDNQELVESWL